VLGRGICGSQVPETSCVRDIYDDALAANARRVRACVPLARNIHVPATPVPLRIRARVRVCDQVADPKCRPRPGIVTGLVGLERGWSNRLRTFAAPALGNRVVPRTRTRSGLLKL